MTPKEWAETTRNGFMGWGDSVFFGDRGAQFVEALSRDFERCIEAETRRCADIADKEMAEWFTASEGNEVAETIRNLILEPLVKGASENR